MTNPQDWHLPDPYYKPETAQTCEEADSVLADFVTRTDGLWIGTSWKCLGCGGHSYIPASMTPHFRLVPWY